MLGYFVLGAAGVVVALLLARWFVTVPASDLAQAARTFLVVFTALASTGLLLMGRFGLALVTIAATVMALRALRRGQRAADPMGEAGPAPGPSSTVTTDLLEMRLDHASGALEGRVRSGPFAGRELAGLALDDLLALLNQARREDPSSVALLETYLDRVRPDWRAREFEGEAPGGSGSAMDERTALEILGLETGASEAQIRAAHRRLMSRLHPDHGGSDWLASRINQARDYLLRRSR